MSDGDVAQDEAAVEQKPRTMAYAFEWGADGEFYQGQAFEDEIIVQMTDEQRKRVIAMLLDTTEDDPDEFW